MEWSRSLSVIAELTYMSPTTLKMTNVSLWDILEETKGRPRYVSSLVDCKRATIETRQMVNPTGVTEAARSG